MNAPVTAGTAIPPTPLSPSLQRLLTGAREGAEGLVADLQKAVRELSALSLGYSGHSLRAGVRDDALAAIDAELGENAAALARALFDVQQRLQLDVLTLGTLARIEEVVDLEDERPLPARLRDGLDGYVAGLGPRLAGTRETVGGIAVRLAVLANNTEIAACRLGRRGGAPTETGAGADAAVELFMLVTARMRTLARRLRGIAEALAVFQGTQEGYVDAVRAALLSVDAGTASAGAALAGENIYEQTRTGEAA